MSGPPPITGWPNEATFSNNCLTCTPNIPKIMKKVQQMSTMFPIGLNEERRVWTTSLRPGARLITLKLEKC
jgi:hypothetical protein